MEISPCLDPWPNGNMKNTELPPDAQPSPLVKVPHLMQTIEVFTRPHLYSPKVLYYPILVWHRQIKTGHISRTNQWICKNS